MPRLSVLAPGLLTVLLWLGPDARAAEPAAGEHGAAAAAHGEEEQPNILKGDVALAVSTLIVFALLLAVLGKFAWGPLQKALHEREEHLEQTLEQSEKARHEAERLLAEHRAQMAQANEQIRALIEKAHRDADSTAAEILRKAQDEAEASRHRAEREIETAKDQALLEIWNKGAELAVSVAGRVLERELSDADHRRLVDLAVNELPEKPLATNGHGGQA